MSRSTLYVAVFAVGSTACASGARPAAVPGGASLEAASESRVAGTHREFGEVGQYRVEERRDGLAVIRGTFTVRADTVLLDAEPGPCRSEASLQLSGSIGFSCADVVVRFDRLRPASRAAFTWNRSVKESRRVCAAEGMDARGRPVCIRWRNETVEHTVRTTSRIRSTKE